MKLRIIWKQGRSGGQWAERMASPQRNGGTCAWGGHVLIYDDLSGQISIQGGKALYQRRPKGFVNSCGLEEVAAIFIDGKQIYPDAPPR